MPITPFVIFFSFSFIRRPVSAYALFFRDTQASIKGQNPNASFGEVSKIVASMWDVLAPDHKNVSIRKGERTFFLRGRTVKSHHHDIAQK